jgi:hypothetical protein
MVRGTSQNSYRISFQRRKSPVSNLPPEAAAVGGVSGAAPKGIQQAAQGSSGILTPTTAPATSTAGRARRATTNIRPNVGKREVKEYPLTESDIENLGLTKGGATFFFSVGSLLLGFVLNRIKDASSWDAFANGMSSPVSAFAVGAAAVCYLVGAYLWFRNGSTIRRIKQEMKFDG